MTHGRTKKRTRAGCAERGSERRAYFQWDSHFDPAGHAMVASILETWLLTQCDAFALPVEGCSKAGEIARSDFSGAQSRLP